MALHLTGLNFGMIVGGTLGGYLGQTFGWRPAFAIIGGCGILLAVVCSFVVKDRRVRVTVLTADESPKSGWRDIVRILSVPTYVIVVTQAMLVAVSTWIFSNWLPLYYSETFHLNLANAGFSGTFMTQAPALLGIVAGGRYSDMLARHQAHKRMLFQAICLCVATPPLLAFLGSPGYLLISASIFLYSLAISVSMANEHPILCDVLPAHLRGTAIGCMNTANCFAGGAGILVAGILKSHLGIGTIFGCASVLMLTAALLVLCGYCFFIRKDLIANAAKTDLALHQSPSIVSPPVHH
jgi:predicted MFS family arabinose efflux permease